MCTYLRKSAIDDAFNTLVCLSCIAEGARTCQARNLRKRSGFETVKPAAPAKGIRLQVMLDPPAGPRGNGAGQSDRAEGVGHRR